MPTATLPESKVAAFAMEDAFFLGTLSSRCHVTWAVNTGAFLGVGNDANYNHSDCFEPFPFPACDEPQRKTIRDLGEALDGHRKRQQAAHPDLTITGMYNVLEKLRADEVLNAKEKVIHEHGLVSVLKKIHDDLDAAVFGAYGWPHDLTDEQILERLVALNAERAEEEKRGLVRWLRPDYQTKVVKGAKVAEQTEIAIEEPAPPAPKKRGRKAKAEEPEGRGTLPPAEPRTEDKPRWPDSMPDQIAAVRDLVLATRAGWTAEAVARSFKYGRAGSAESVLDSLAALGLVVRYEKNGERMWKATGRE